MHIEIIKILVTNFLRRETNCTRQYFKIQTLCVCLYIYTEKNGTLENKICALSTTEMKTSVFNKSLQSEVIQMTTEAANIIPVFKNGGGTYLVNY